MKEENKTTLLKLVIDNEAISLALITAFSLLVSFAWEGGKLLFYGAPWRFMELNTITILVASATFILIFSPFAFQLLPYIKEYKSFKLHTRCAIIAFCYIVPAYIGCFRILNLNDIFIVNLAFILIFFWLLALAILYLMPAIPVVFSCNLCCREYLRNLYKLERLLSFRNKSLIAKYPLLLLIASYILGVVFLTSYSLESQEKSFWMIEAEPNSFIITNYGDRVIVGTFLENKKYFSKCIKVRSIGDKPLSLFKVKLSNSPEKKLKKADETCM